MLAGSGFKKMPSPSSKGVTGKPSVVLAVVDSATFPSGSIDDGAIVYNSTTGSIIGGSVLVVSTIGGATTPDSTVGRVVFWISFWRIGAVVINNG